jgi:hypothetical protein
MLGREDPARPTVEELGARSEQRQAQLMAEASASAPHNSTLTPNRRSHYDRQATVEKIAANEVRQPSRVVSLRIICVQLATVRQNDGPHLFLCKTGAIHRSYKKIVSKTVWNRISRNSSRGNDHRFAHGFYRTGNGRLCVRGSDGNSFRIESMTMLFIQNTLISMAVHTALNRRRSDRTYRPAYFPPSCVGSG